MAAIPLVLACDGSDADVRPADVRVTLHGVELAPGIEHPLELGSARTGGAFAPAYELVIENPSDSAVSLGTTVPANFFAEAPQRLEPHESVTISVGMLPTVAGSQQGRIELHTSVIGKEVYAFALDGDVVDGFPNPYHPARAWRLWFDDATPLSFTGLLDPDGDGAGTTTTLDAAPPLADARVFPTPAALAATWPDPFLGVALQMPAPDVAGWWDDAVGTMDNGHSSVPARYAPLDLTGQFTRIYFGRPTAQQRRDLGLIATSESYAYRGHQLTRDSGNVTDIERNWLFVNAVRGTPGFHSYNDTDALRVADNYDGLQAHMYQSFGRSSSETVGLQKMLVAGGFMPRRTKDLLKRHGLYATALVTLFRESLPYVDAAGTALPYEHELRHRPVYLSNGESTVQTVEFGGDNMTYHQYPERLHLFAMVQGAKALTTAPPIALAKLVSVSSAAGPWAMTDPRIKVRARTQITVWPTPGEEVTLRVDLGESIDLEGGALELTAHAVYPHQRSALTITREGKTAVFRITATPDAAFPRGRMPVLLQAHVRGHRSNPVFVNIYWPADDQLVIAGTKYFHPTLDGSYHTNDPRTAVHLNARPTLTTSLGATTTIAGAIGVPVSFDVSCVDPEGFATEISRRADDPGVLQGGTYTLSPTKSGNIQAAFICSDGTGAYSSRTITIATP